jgi:hypothetical protein
MQIEIDFRPDTGGVQTLHADLPVKDVEELERVTADPANADDVVYIPSRVKRDGPVKEWMFRVGRITIRRVPE